MSQQFQIQMFSRELLLPAQALQQLDQAKKQRPSLQMLDAHAVALGFKPAIAPKNVLGFKETYRSQTLIKNPKKPAETVQDLVFELHVQDYLKPASKDLAAIATVHLTAPNIIPVEYEMLLEAPNAGFLHAREFIVQGNKVVPAKSWWSRTRKCLTQKCISTCVTSVFTCSGTWVAYLGCVAALCGGCFVRCSACARCDCSWWCKWAVGCCE